MRKKPRLFLNNVLFCALNFIIWMLLHFFSLKFLYLESFFYFILAYGDFFFIFQSLTVHNFYFGEGSDSTGVPTKMVTMNSSVRMTVYNRATFFGIHVSSTPINLMYSEIAVATGQVNFLM